MLEMFCISLALTLLFELPVVWCFGLRTGRQLLLAVLVNILTNPAAVLLHLWGIPQLPIELAVVALEAFVYRRFGIRRPLPLSLTANTISWTLGLLIQQ